MTFNASLENLEEMFEHIDSLIAKTEAEAADFETAAYKTKLACEEVLVNIASYAYPNGDGQLDVAWEHDLPARAVRIVFSDAGIAFNPLEKAKPAIDAPIEERQIGGLGIMMVRKVMDSVEYGRIDGKNILTLTKRY